MRVIDLLRSGALLLCYRCQFRSHVHDTMQKV